MLYTIRGCILIINNFKSPEGDTGGLTRSEPDAARCLFRLFIFMIEQLERTLGNRVYQLGESDILEFAKLDNSVFAVVSGIKKYSYLVWQYNPDDTDIYLAYVSRLNEKLYGSVLRVGIQLSNKNRIIYLYAYTISRIFNRSLSKVFNTFQDQLTVAYNRMGYITVDSVQAKKMGGGDYLISPSFKGIMVVPFIYPPDVVISSAQRNGSDFVYIIYHSRSGYYKIGRSNNPEVREKTLQAEDPDLKIIRQWPCDSKTVESFLHKKYQSKRLRGEWFVLDEIDLLSISSYMKKKTL